MICWCGYNKARDRNCRPSHPVDNIRHRHQCSYFIIVYVLMSSFRNSLSQFQNSFHIFFSFHFEFIWIIEAEQKTKFVENEIFQMMNAGPIKMQIMFYNWWISEKLTLVLWRFRTKIIQQYLSANCRYHGGHFVWALK